MPVFPSKISLCLLAFVAVSTGSCKPAPQSSSSNIQEKVSPLSEAPSTPLPQDAVYVSPQGKDSGSGSREDPLASIEAAFSKLPSGKEGTIALLGGSYPQPGIISASTNEEPVPVLVTAAPGENVIFEGGNKISQWEGYPEKPGLYIVDAPDRETMFEQMQWFDVWENGNRVRYRKAADAAGVEAYPGSVTFIDGERLLIHTSSGETPETLDLWHNRRANGLSIGRSNTTLRGIRFQNYVGGGEARALTIWKDAKNVTIEDCEFVNCAIGISTGAANTHIEKCNFLEVGLGVRHGGIDMVVRNCLFESAVGRFAFSYFMPALRDGIRIYYDGNGATIENCVTIGFWAGLYIKTSSGDPGARPYLIRNNTFIDGIRAGAISPQPHSTYFANIVGPTSGGVSDGGVLPNGAYLEEIGATLEANYFYGMGGEARGSNRAGPEPFINLMTGNLELRPDIPMPPLETGQELGAAMRTISWSRQMATNLKPVAEKKRAFSFVREPSVTASSAGALVTASLSQAGKSILRYRKSGETLWRAAAGRGNFIPPLDPMRSGLSVEAQTLSEHALIFPLVKGELEAGMNYEFQVEATAPDDETLVSGIGSFRTEGGPKEIPAAAPDGLQDALNRALPGDTVVLEKGLYTQPVILCHGGTPDAPLTIRGAGRDQTILDGGKANSHLIWLRDASHVTLRGLQVRWFLEVGIYAHKSPYGTLDDCWIFNDFLAASANPSGENVLLEESPGWTVTRCIFTEASAGFTAINSPELILEGNTVFSNTLNGVYLVNSSKGSRILRNTLNFTGNESIWISENDPAAFASLVCDFNNYGSLVRMENKYPEDRFTPAKRYGRISEAKRILVSGPIPPEGDWEKDLSEEGHTADKYLNLLFFYRMEDWRKFSGKDTHSIFADPQFVNPRGGDFRLLPGSPNLLPDGQIIGAEGTIE